MFRRLTSVRPPCTRKRTRGQGWIWPTGGCSLQPERRRRQQRKGSAYVCYGWKIMPRNVYAAWLEGVSNHLLATLDSAWQSVSSVHWPCVKPFDSVTAIQLGPSMALFTFAHWTVKVLSLWMTHFYWRNQIRIYSNIKFVGFLFLFANIYLTWKVKIIVRSENENKH